MNPDVADRLASPEELADWLASPEGEAWCATKFHSPHPGAPDLSGERPGPRLRPPPGIQGPLDPAFDPCGRPAMPSRP